MAQSGLTDQLIAFARELRWESIPEEVRTVAAQCLLDHMGCAVAGCREPLVDALVETLVSDDSGGAARLVGRPERCSPSTAALVNGAASHALDYDDTHLAMIGHPCAPVIPALLALANREQVSGEALLTALVCGIEFECRLSGAIGLGHYTAGFHTTGTLGSFGAAAAASHLLGLDQPAWSNAIGLAGTQAAGLKSAFGTMAKPFHAGRAAQAGFSSALLAQAGFTAAKNVVETNQGFATTHAGQPLSPEPLAPFEGLWLTREVLFKYHAACYLTHAAIEAAGLLRKRHDLDPEKVSAVELEVNPTLMGVCNIQEPATGLEGKFSLRVTTALALLAEDTSDPALYSDAKVTEPRLVALRDRVSVNSNESLTPTQARVVVESRGGRVEAQLDSGVPAADLVVQGERLRNKFHVLSAPYLGADRSEKLAATVHSARELTSASELVSLSCPS